MLLCNLDDFFDSSLPAVSHSGSILKADETAEREGFFDDPVRDAKMRNVEAAQDLMDKEWDEFQKEWDEFQNEVRQAMRQVDTESYVIQAEDNEEGYIELYIQYRRRPDMLRDIWEVLRHRQKVLVDRRKVLRDRRDAANETNEEDQRGGGIEDIQEQIQHYLLAAVLQDRWEELRDRRDVKSKSSVPERHDEQEAANETNTEENEEELLDLLSLDWRAKGALA